AVCLRSYLPPSGRGVPTAPGHTSSAPSRDEPVRLPLFSQRLAGHLLLQQGLGQQLLQPCILLLQGLQSLGLRDLQATELAPPQVVARLREAMAPTQFLDR